MVASDEQAKEGVQTDVYTFTLQTCSVKPCA